MEISVVGTTGKRRADVVNSPTVVAKAIRTISKLKTSVRIPVYPNHHIKFVRCQKLLVLVLETFPDGTLIRLVACVVILFIPAVRETKTDLLTVCRVKTCATKQSANIDQISM